jgi:hypothetical protein
MRPTERWPVMSSGRFEIRHNGALGFDVRLEGNPEAFRHWGERDVLTKEKEALMDEVEAWCASVLAYNH